MPCNYHRFFLSLIVTNQPLFPFGIYILLLSRNQSAVTAGTFASCAVGVFLCKEKVIISFPRNSRNIKNIIWKCCLLEGIKMDEWDLRAAIWSITLLFEMNLSIRQRFITSSCAVMFTPSTRLEFTSNLGVSAAKQEVEKMSPQAQVQTEARRLAGVWFSSMSNPIYLAWDVILIFDKK